jgi:hypothetical protein
LKVWYPEPSKPVILEDLYESIKLEKGDHYNSIKLSGLKEGRYILKLKKFNQLI